MKRLAYATVGFTDRNIHRALEDIASCGFNEAQILGDSPHLPVPLKGSKLKELLKTIEGLSLSITMHAPYSIHVLGGVEEEKRTASVKVLSDYIRFSASLGALEMVVHPLPHPTKLRNPEDPGLYDRIREAARRSLDTLTPLALECNIILLLENQPRDGNFSLKNMTELVEFIDPYPPDHVGLIIDTGHSALKKYDPAEEIRIAGDRLKGTHLQDIDLNEPADSHYPPSQGSLDWSSIIKALKEIGYGGAWTFEVGAGRNNESPIELARFCRRKAEEWDI